MLHRMLVLLFAGTGLIAGGSSVAPVSAATSRATPSTDRQSARFGVSLSVSTWSSRPSAARTSLPGFALRQLQQPAVILRQAELARRAQHALALDAAQRAP